MMQWLSCRLIEGVLRTMGRFEVATSVEGDRTVVTVAGECDLAVRDELTSVLLDAVSAARVVVVDLADVSFLDSSGVHALIAGYHAAQEPGGRFYAVNAVGVVESVLAMTEVDALLRPPRAGAATGPAQEPDRYAGAPDD